MIHPNFFRVVLLLNQVLLIIKDTYFNLSFFNFADIITENGEDIGFSAVFQKMVEEGFEDLPPGGGIHSKYVIEVHLLTCTLMQCVTKVF